MGKGGRQRIAESLEHERSRESPYSWDRKNQFQIGRKQQNSESQKQWLWKLSAPAGAPRSPFKATDRQYRPVYGGKPSSLAPSSGSGDAKTQKPAAAASYALPKLPTGLLSAAATTTFFFVFAQLTFKYGPTIVWLTGLTSVHHLLSDKIAPALEHWERVRKPYLVPLIQWSVYASTALLFLLTYERVGNCLCMLWLKARGWKPSQRWKFAPLSRRGDVEAGASSAFPMVLVQVPMFNEVEVYYLSIAAACHLDWPQDRILIQVLDDSNDPSIAKLIRAEVGKWQQLGKNISYHHREHRHGYKAGSLKEAMVRPEARDCEFVAIFDADFQPESDYLMRTMPYLVHNQELGLVQARWAYVNSGECLLTRLQQMSMDYHFEVEQQVGGAYKDFFGFNGTAGVWRIRAIEEAGGWDHRTTVEDMDLALRAALAGWKFVYLNDVRTLSELPSTYKAYRNQQYRWTCGPAALFRLTFWRIVHSNALGRKMKVYILVWFFLVRKMVACWITFGFFCVIVPMATMLPEVWLPNSISTWLPLSITVSIALGSISSSYLVLLWLFFENVTTMMRIFALRDGLLGVGAFNSWIVTLKLGSRLNPGVAGKKAKLAQWLQQRLSRIYFKELVMGMLLLTVSTCAIHYRYGWGAAFMLMQGAAFVVCGLGLVGTHDP